MNEVIRPANAYVDNGDHINVIPWEHAYLHKGVMFFAGVAQAALANNGTIDLILEVGADDQAHLAWPPTVEAGGDCTVALYEGATYTGGSGATEWNCVREGETAPGVASAVAGLDSTSTLSVLTGATVTATGNLVGGAANFIPGGAGLRAVGGTAQGRTERVLARSTTYLVRLTNISGNANRFHEHLSWYDHGAIYRKNMV